MSKNADKVKIWLSPENYISAEKGTNLRLALKDHFSELYNGTGRFIHCRGLGTCGTCAIHIEGPVSDPTKIEKWRLNFPPHKNSIEKGLRLACQTQVLSDVRITKWSGLWGNKELL